MERFTNLLLKLGYRRLPKILADSPSRIEEFVRLYKYPVLIESNKTQLIIGGGKDLEQFKNTELGNVTVKKYFKTAVSLTMEYHSEYNMVSIDIEKDNHVFPIRINPLVSLTNHKVIKMFPEIEGFSNPVCDCYNLFLDNNYKIMHMDFYRNGEEIYFSSGEKKKSKNREYDDIMIAYNAKTVGEYVNDIFKRYGKHAFLVPVEKMEDEFLNYSNVFVAIVNDRERMVDGYMDILKNTASVDKRIFCMYEGVRDKDIKGKLMRENIIFTGDPYRFIKSLVNEER